ncbi:MAG TPA: aldo/keto reductase [Gammaproteobacteria bacterium]|nr:aldo/keto reductase [Gammaproteobacteria bacterium]
MRMRRLGRTGLEVSEVGLGCNNFGARVDLETSRAVVHAALDAGVNFFDTADVYGGRGGSESILGRVLGERRKDVVLATKFGSAMEEGVERRNASRRYILQAVEASLKRLKTDWIDLYYVHWPDKLTPLDETLRALDDLVRSGKVHYVGCCNFAAWRVVAAEWIARELKLHRFVCAQNEFSLLERAPEKELLPALAEYDLGLVPYFPLASGLLTGKYERDKPPPDDSRLAQWKRLAESYATPTNWDLIEKLEAWAGERDHSLLEFAFAWLLAHGAVASVIAGATKPEQVAANVRAAEWRLDADDLASLREILDG